MRLTRAELLRYAIQNLFRAWLIFSANAVLWVIGTLVFIEYDNPLRSDDPHIVGFVFGIVSVAAFVVFSLADPLGPALRNRIYIGGLILWCLVCWLGTLGSEGAGIGAFSAIGSAISGAITLPLCRFRFRPLAAEALAWVGIGYVMMWVIAANHLMN